MKVIKYGPETDSDRFLATCKHCKSIIEMTRSEGVPVNTRLGKDIIEAKCPVCTQTIFGHLKK
jgi:hypothetical protein